MLFNLSYKRYHMYGYNVTIMAGDDLRSTVAKTSAAMILT